MTAHYDSKSNSVNFGTASKGAEAQGNEPTCPIKKFYA